MIGKFGQGNSGISKSAKVAHSESSCKCVSGRVSQSKARCFAPHVAVRCLLNVGIRICNEDHLTGANLSEFGRKQAFIRMTCL